MVPLGPDQVALRRDRVAHHVLVVAPRGRLVARDDVLEALAPAGAEVPVTPLGRGRIHLLALLPQVDAQELVHPVVRLPPPRRRHHAHVQLGGRRHRVRQLAVEIARLVEPEGPPALEQVPLVRAVAVLVVRRADGVEDVVVVLQDAVRLVRELAGEDVAELPIRPGDGAGDEALDDVEPAQLVLPRADRAREPRGRVAHRAVQRLRALARRGVDHAGQRVAVLRLEPALHQAELLDRHRRHVERGAAEHDVGDGDPVHERGRLTRPAAADAHRREPAPGVHVRDGVLVVQREIEEPRLERQGAADVGHRQRLDRLARDRRGAARRIELDQRHPLRLDHHLLERQRLRRELEVERARDVDPDLDVLPPDRRVAEELRRHVVRPRRDVDEEVAAVLLRQHGPPGPFDGDLDAGQWLPRRRVDHDPGQLTRLACGRVQRTRGEKQCRGHEHEATDHCTPPLH